VRCAVFPASFAAVSLIAVVAGAQPSDAPEPTPEQRQHQQILALEVARIGLLIGSFGAGAKVSFCGLKWDGFYVIPIVAGFSTLIVSGEAFAGLEAGFLYISGRSYFSLGSLAGFGSLSEYHESDGRDASRGARGFTLRPTFRYRYYWGDVGLEFSAEYPIAWGRPPCSWLCTTQHTGGPVFGVGLGW